MEINKKLACVILTKNAATQVENCLKSISSWANEIIIVDGESQDETVSICKKYTSKVFVRPFLGSFSEDRNFGASQSSCDWILQLDADEVVTDDFKKKFEEIRDHPNFHAYKTLRKNFFLGKCMDRGPWYHHIQVLYLNEHVKFSGRVHERLEVRDDQVGVLNAHIEHYPFTSIGQFLERHNRYTSLAAQELIEAKEVLPWPIIRHQLFYKSIKFFWKLYVIKKGYRDGIHGLIFSILFSFEHFLKWAKYWELVQKKEKYESH